MRDAVDTWILRRGGRSWVSRVCGKKDEWRRAAELPGRRTAAVSLSGGRDPGRDHKHKHTHTHTYTHSESHVRRRLRTTRDSRVRHPLFLLLLLSPLAATAPLPPVPSPTALLCVPRSSSAPAVSVSASASGSSSSSAVAARCSRTDPLQPSSQQQLLSALCLVLQPLSYPHTHTAIPTKPSSASARFSVC